MLWRSSSKPIVTNGEMCKYRGLKVTLILLNVLVLICGIVLLGLGAFGLHQLPRYSRVDDYRLNGVLIGFIVIGCVLCVTAIFGIVCSFIRNAFLILLYIIVLIVVIVGQSICGIIAATYRSKIDQHIMKAIETYVGEYYQNSQYRTIMDAIQTDYKCCGAKAPSDYESGKVPQSCYGNNQVMLRGCTSIILKKTQDYLGVLFGCCFAFLIVEVVCILISFFLMNALDKEFSSV